MGRPIMDDAQFRIWKTQLVPLIYDWFSNHNLNWPTQACRWGPKLESHTYKDRYRIYLSEQTDLRTKEPPKLLVVDAELCKPRVASTEVVATWTDFSKCPFIREIKTVVHPGEVNKIRELPQHPEVLVTHTDAPELYIWNIEKQPNQVRGPDKKWPAASVAEAVLEGHMTPANESLFALATSNAAPRVASGGPDKLVLIWDLSDAQDGILAGKRGADNASTTRIKPRTEFKGHKNTVEDVVFSPGSGDELVSVGDDKQVLFWDARTGTAPVMRIEAAHGNHDIHCVDWNKLDADFIATGAADGSLRIWDRRKLTGSTTHKGSAAVKTFKQHTEAIMRIEWHPTDKFVLASGGDDHLVLVWDLGRSSIRDDSAPAAATKSGTEAGAGAAPAKADGGGAASGSKGGGSGGKGAPPPELLFKHVGHRCGKVVDFQWCPADPWTILSVSDDSQADDGTAPGGPKGGASGSKGAPKDAKDAAGAVGGGAAAAADGAAASAAAAAAAAAAAGGVLAPGVPSAPRGGGTLQIWRVNDLIYRPEDEVIEEMEQHREWILEGTNEPPKPRVPPAVSAQANSRAAAANASPNVKEEEVDGAAAPSASAGAAGSKRQGGASAGATAGAGDEAQQRQNGQEQGQQQRASADGEVASQSPAAAAKGEGAAGGGRASGARAKSSASPAAEGEDPASEAAPMEEDGDA